MSILHMLFKAIWDLIRAFFGSIGSLLRNLFHPLWRLLQTTFKFQGDDIKRPLLVLVSIIVIVASLISIYLSFRTPTPKINPNPFIGLGEVAADHAVKLLGGRGEVVMVVLELDQRVAATAIQVPPDTFRDRLRKHPQIRITAVETIKPQMQTMFAPGVLWSADQFLDLVQKHARADLIVTFVGVPPLREEQIAALPKRRPKIFDVSASGLSTRALLEADVIQLAIGPRFRPMEASQPEPKTPREWFERHYAVYTKDDVSGLPSLPMAVP